MNRRQFISTAVLSMATIRSFGAQSSSSVSAKQNQCIPNLDYISTESTHFQVYEHYHRLSIPISALILPPSGGVTVKTSMLDQSSLDKKKYTNFIEQTKRKFESLINHDHEFVITQEQLERIASGEREVEVKLLSPIGNLTHIFYFTASKSALIKINRARKSGA